MQVEFVVIGARMVGSAIADGLAGRRRAVIALDAGTLPSGFDLFHHRQFDVSQAA
ncbi:MAG TPA: hypothetical protein VNT30_23705 [Stellaceae bacterium]|nr:hypothetical protein [Stellaceae bacterium]